MWGQASASNYQTFGNLPAAPSPPDPPCPAHSCAGRFPHHARRFKNRFSPKPHIPMAKNRSAPNRKSPHPCASRHFFAYPVFPAEIRLKTGYAAFPFSQLFRAFTNAPALGRNAYGSYDLGESRPRTRRQKCRIQAPSKQPAAGRPSTAKNRRQNRPRPRGESATFQGCRVCPRTPFRSKSKTPRGEKTQNRYLNPGTLERESKKRKTHT